MSTCKYKDSPVVRYKLYAKYNSDDGILKSISKIFKNNITTTSMTMCVKGNLPKHIMEKVYLTNRTKSASKSFLFSFNKQKLYLECQAPVNCLIPGKKFVMNIKINNQTSKQVNEVKAVLSVNYKRSTLR